MASPFETAMAKIRKDYGESGNCRALNGPADEVEAVTSGSMSFDRALGIGGYPRGKIIEIFGPESSAKTTLTQLAIASFQRIKRKDGSFGNALEIDVEHAYDPPYSSSLGVSFDKSQFALAQPDTAEIALNMIVDAAESGTVDLIVLDSVAGLTPEAELAGEIGDSHVGITARLMGQTMRKLVGIASRTNTTIIFINQVRDKIGVMYGDPSTTTGGKALKFFASIRVRMGNPEKIMSGTSCIGIKAKASIIKNKCAPPFMTAEFPIIFGKGIDYELDLVNTAKSLRVLGQTGSIYNINGQKFKGANEVLEAVRADQKFSEHIRSLCLGVQGYIPEESTAVPDAEELNAAPIVLEE